MNHIYVLYTYLLLFVKRRELRVCFLLNIKALFYIWKKNIHYF